MSIDNIIDLVYKIINKVGIYGILYTFGFIILYIAMRILLKKIIN